MMATLFTELVRMTPVPLPTVQVWPAGCVNTVTVKVAELVNFVGNVNAVAPGAGLVVSVPLASTRPFPVRPLIVPPTVNAAEAQAT